MLPFYLSRGIMAITDDRREKTENELDTFCELLKTYLNDRSNQSYDDLNALYTVYLDDLRKEITRLKRKVRR